MEAQMLSYLPVPIGAKTIAPAIPNAKNKPGKTSKKERDQIQLPCFVKHPSCDIEECKQGVKDKEKNVQEGIPHINEVSQII